MLAAIRKVIREKPISLPTCNVCVERQKGKTLPPRPPSTMLVSLPEMKSISFAYSSVQFQVHVCCTFALVYGRVRVNRGLEENMGYN